MIYCGGQGSSYAGRRRAGPPTTHDFRPAQKKKKWFPPGTIFYFIIIIFFFSAFFAKDTHHTAQEQNYFLEKCSEPVHCDPFGRTAIKSPISELIPAQTLLGCARH